MFRFTIFQVLMHVSCIFITILFYFFHCFCKCINKAMFFFLYHHSHLLKEKKNLKINFYKGTKIARRQLRPAEKEIIFYDSFIFLYIDCCFFVDVCLCNCQFISLEALRCRNGAFDTSLINFRIQFIDWISDSVH